MNKIGLVLPLVAVAAVTGCLDPQYKSKRTVAEPKEVVTPDTVVVPVKPVEKVTPPEPTPIEVVETKDVEPKVEPKVVEPAYTMYIVQRGDTLSGISKRFNIKLSSIKDINPQIKKDIVRLGQKIKLPGKVDVGEQKIPEGSFAKNTANKSSKPAPAKFTGSTKEYVVKNGDTLGEIAKASGITVRQLKEMNGLSKDTIRVGQKLVVPAKAKVKAATSSDTKKTADVKNEKVEEVVKPTTPPAENVPADGNVPVVQPDPIIVEPVETPVKEPVVVEPTLPAEKVAPVVVEKPEYREYIVKDGEDLVNVSLNTAVDIPVLREINGIPDGEDVKVGQVIKIPVLKK